MHAALITGAGQVELREFPAPTPTDTGVVVDISFCGVCGTDVHAFQSGRPYTPAICGHEWTGVISAKGRGATSFTEGDRVVVAVPHACGHCVACQRGLGEKCQSSMSVAAGRDDQAPPHGGFASQIGVSTNRIVKADPALTDEQLAQVEPTTISLHAVRGSRIRLGDTAVIQGAGPIGVTTLQFARAAGAGKTIVIEPNEHRRKLAMLHGASVVTTPDEAGDIVNELTNGLGADIVYECVGRPETLQDGVNLARRGGSLCLIGLADGDATITPGLWLRKEINLTAALAYAHEEFEMAMGLMADGRITVDHLHTSTASLSGLSEVLTDLGSGQSGQTKVLIKPTWE